MQVEMRIGIISYHPTDNIYGVSRNSEIIALQQHAIYLNKKGHQVWWVSSTDTIKAIDAHTGAEALMQGKHASNYTSKLPTTCQYVVPCQVYRFQGGEVFCIDCSVWQQPSLRTRLFTFLCLLQRALPCEVWNVWGAFPAGYLAVYTARFMGLPVVVSYNEQYLRDGSQQSFEWHWVAQHASQALVACEADRKHLAATSILTPKQIQIVNPVLLEASASDIDLYESLLQRDFQ